MTTRYLLNSAVIPVGADGIYDYHTLSQAEAVDWLTTHQFTSRIGYQNTADFIERISNVRVEISRAASEFLPGDEALIVRLAYRETDPGTKTGQTAQRNDFVFGLLTSLKL